VRRYAIFLLDYCLQENEFMDKGKYNAQTLAVSIIITARKQVGIDPVWHPEFLSMFKTDPTRVSECFSKL